MSKEIIQECEMHIQMLIDNDTQASLGIDGGESRPLGLKVLRLCSAYNALAAENEKLADDFNYAHEKKKELQAENERLKEQLRWIPVSERLPEDDGIYLTKYKGDKRQRHDEKMHIRSYPFWGIYKTKWVYKNQTKYSITHWKPIVLPEAKP